MANAIIVPFEHQITLADSIAKSGMFGIRTRDQALVLMALCESEGLHPIVACRDFHIISGRPALKADAMLARFHAAGGKVKWTSYTDDRVSGIFTHPVGGGIEVEWTIEAAKRAGLAGKDVWKQYPRAMLRSRVISEAIRTVFPGVLAGMYTPEEVADMPAEPGNGNGKRELKDVTPKRTPGDDLADFAGDPAAKTQAGGTPHDPVTGEVIEGNATDVADRPHGIPLQTADGVTDWAGWCAALKTAYMEAEDPDTLTATLEQNQETLATMRRGGDGGRKAAEKLGATYNERLLDLQRKAAAMAAA